MNDCLFLGTVSDSSFTCFSYGDGEVALTSSRNKELRAVTTFAHAYRKCCCSEIVESQSGHIGYSLLRRSALTVLDVAHIRCCRVVARDSHASSSFPISELLILRTLNSCFQRSSKRAASLHFVYEMASGMRIAFF